MRLNRMEWLHVEAAQLTRVCMRLVRVANALTERCTRSSSSERFVKIHDKRKRSTGAVQLDLRSTGASQTTNKQESTSETEFDLKEPLAQEAQAVNPVSFAKKP